MRLTATPDQDFVEPTVSTLVVMPAILVIVALNLCL